VTTVLKIGGGLPRDRGDAALRALCAAVGNAAARHPLLVVPGGGAFADAVRAEDARFGLRAPTTHEMAILAMDQFGLMLRDLVPGAGVCRDFETAAALACDGRAPILLPAALVLAADGLPASWDVTSDSIAAWVAGRAGARRVVLVKGVRGLYDGPPGEGEPIGTLGTSRLAALQREGRAGGVDPYFATALAAARVEGWIVGGDDPARLAQLLDTGTTTGTQVTADAPPSRLRVAPLLQ
jgi:5-(aminomethyl)-3-furanmethanol phosphate kinase